MDPVKPKFGEVWRDAGKGGGAVVMWLSSKDYAVPTDRPHGTIVVLQSGPYWGDAGAIQSGVSWLYLGWEVVDGP